MSVTHGLKRPPREKLQEQTALFELPPMWQDAWWGMPSFEMVDAKPTQRITVNFQTLDDVIEFGRRLGITVTPTTDSVWFPVQSLDRPSESDWEYGDDS